MDGQEQLLEENGGTEEKDMAELKISVGPLHLLVDFLCVTGNFCWSA